MRRDHISLFDGDAVDTDDITREFWGETRGWAAHERHHDAGHQTMDVPEHPSGVQQIWREEPTGALRAIRDGLTAFRPRTRPEHTGPIARTRRHGTVPGATTYEATLAELAGGRPGGLVHGADEVDAGLDEYEVGAALGPYDELVPLTPAQPLSVRLGLDAVDPLLVRIGIVVTAVVLLLPLALGLRDGDAGAVVTETSIEAPTDLPAGVPPGVVAGTADAAPPVGAATELDTSTSDPAATGAPSPASSAVESSSVTEQAAATELSAETAVAAASEQAASAGGTGSAVVDEQAAGRAAVVATVEEVAERIVPDCSLTYPAAPGDSWYRIADAAGISPTALLAANRATVETVILPGDEICLPEGATVPTPPTTTAPATTAPAVPAAPTTAPPTTAGPATTVAPASRSEVQQIIRDVWPDELEARALEIAWRESGFVATAHNGWCCYGVFQLYWTVHRSWLDDYGILSSTDLYDARKNVTAAYALYQRSGGWGPWGG